MDWRRVPARWMQAGHRRRRSRARQRVPPPPPPPLRCTASTGRGVISGATPRAGWHPGSSASCFPRWSSPQHLCSTTSSSKPRNRQIGDCFHRRRLRRRRHPRLLGPHHPDHLGPRLLGRRLAHYLPPRRLPAHHRPTPHHPLHLVPRLLAQRPHPLNRRRLAHYLPPHRLPAHHRPSPLPLPPSRRHLPLSLRYRAHLRRHHPSRHRGDRPRSRRCRGSRHRWCCRHQSQQSTSMWWTRQQVSW